MALANKQSTLQILSVKIYGQLNHYLKSYDQKLLQCKAFYCSGDFARTTSFPLKIEGCYQW